MPHKQVHAGSSPAPATIQNILIMAAIFLFELFINAVMGALGILAWKGQRWAFIAFIVMIILRALVDILGAVAIWTADKEPIKKIEP